MRGFTEDEDRANEQQPKKFSNKYKFFRDVLEKVQSEHHPNTEYFIYKSIILNNLYGVDIMREAVEIAKLRLFLKLVATVEADYKKPNLGLEPLPDIDFNIRSGNTLIGFATEDELKKGLRYTLDGVAAAPVIEEKCEIVANAFARYKEIQLSYGDDFKEFKKAKTELSKRLKELNKELNKLLHKQADGLKYDDWLETHQPFHWFAEFYEIIHDRHGFDVIIGNPPYVEYAKVPYELKSYETIKCGNLYAFVAENCIRLLNVGGRMGMIVQNSIVCTKRMLPIQKLLHKNYSIYYSNYDDRPAKLFTGIHHMKGTIFITVPSKNKTIYTTKFYRWYEQYRYCVFETIRYAQPPKKLIFDGHIPKLSEDLHISILEKIYKNKPLGLSLTASGKKVYCHRIASYFIKSMDFVPYFYNEKIGEKKSDDYKEYYVANEQQQHVLMALFNSGIFYLNWHTLHDGYHCGKKNIDEYPFQFPQFDTLLSNQLISISKQIGKDYKRNAFRKETLYKNTGIVIYDEFYPKKSKDFIDEADKLFSKHYSFTEFELDFIINYDIKYRLGRDLEEEEE